MNGPEHWPIGSPTGSLASRTIDIWGWRMDEISLASADLLPPFDVENLASISHSAVRQRAIASTVGMRQILSTYLGITSTELEIVRSDYGKPSLAKKQLIDFNLTHSGDWILLAVTDERVGIDLETPRRLRDVEALVRRISTHWELDEWLACPADERARAFYRLWTKKEAVTKLDGRGLQLSMAAIGLTELDSNRSHALWPDGSCDVSLLFDNDTGVAAVATENCGLDFECRRWNARLETDG